MWGFNLPEAIRQHRWFVIQFKDPIRNMDHTDCPASAFKIVRKWWGKWGKIVGIKTLCPCTNVEEFIPINNVANVLCVPDSLCPHPEFRQGYVARLVASEYLTTKTCFRDKERLVEALKQQFGANNVEVYETGHGANLYGYQGDKRKQKAEIIVRKKHVGDASNDLGWYLDQESGYYMQHVSAYDKGGHYNQAKQDQVEFNYNKLCVDHVVATNNYYMQPAEETAEKLVLKIYV